MYYKNTIPATAYGIARKATARPYHGAAPVHTTSPQTFTWNNTARTYEQGGDRNTALEVSAVIQCAGRLPGLYETNGKQICVDSPLKRIEPAAGDCSLINALLENFTTTPDAEESAEQKGRLIAWLRHAAKAVMNSEATSVPVLILRPQEPEQEDSAAFIVANIIKPLLGDTQADLAAYFYPRGHSNYQEFTAQGETAALFFADRPTITANIPGMMYRAHDILTHLTHARKLPELVFPCVLSEDSKQLLEPITCPVILTNDPIPAITSNEYGEPIPAIMLCTNKHTIGQTANGKIVLASDCRAQLPAFLHYLLNDTPDMQPDSYISPTFARNEQKAALTRAYKGETPERTFYKLATLLILASPQKNCLVFSRPDTMTIYKDTTAACRELKMPYPCDDWMPDKLHDILTHCAKLYPAYIQTDDDGGYTINLPAIERDIMPF